MCILYVQVSISSSPCRWQQDCLQKALLSRTELNIVCDIGAHPEFFLCVCVCVCGGGELGIAP
jgi:hypothetical protein